MSDEQGSSGTPASNTGDAANTENVAVLNADAPLSETKENQEGEIPPIGIATKSGKGEIISYEVLVRERKSRQEAQAKVAQMESDKQREIQALRTELENRDALLTQYRSRQPDSVTPSNAQEATPQFKSIDVAKLKEQYGDEIADTMAMLEARALHAEKLAAKGTPNEELMRELEAIRYERAMNGQRIIEEQDRLAEEAKMSNPVLLEWETMPDKHPGKFERAAELDNILRASDRRYLAKSHAERFAYVQRMVELEMGSSGGQIPTDPKTMFKPSSQTPLSSSDLGASGTIRSNNPLDGKTGINLLNAVANLGKDRWKVMQETTARTSTNGVR